MTGEVATGVFQVWNVKSGKSIREFRVPSTVGRDSLTLSPARRYLAMASESK